MQQLLILILAAALGAVLTFYLQKYGVSSVVASSLVGLGGALVASYIKMPELAAVIFTGSFVGMTDLDLGTVPKISIAGALSGLLFGITSNLFVGYGGRLGTIAFASLVICVAFFSLFGQKLKFVPQK